MTVDPILATVIVGSGFAVQGWILLEIVALKTTVAVLNQRLNAAEHQQEKDK